VLVNEEEMVDDSSEPVLVSGDVVASDACSLVPVLLGGLVGLIVAGLLIGCSTSTLMLNGWRVVAVEATIYLKDSTRMNEMRRGEMR